LVEENRMRQFLGAADRYPVGSGFYRRLDSGALGFARVASFKVSPRIPGRAFSEADAEPTIKAFDHPRVSVFRRRADTDVAGLMAAWQAEVEQDVRLPDRHILEGARAYLRRDWRRALMAFQRAVETRPDFLLGHLMMVNTYLRQNRATEAKRTWDWIEAAYDDVPAEAGVGMVKAGLKVDGADYLDQSLAGYRKIGRNVPPWIAREAAQARFELGEEYRRQAQHGKAEAEYMRAVELFPDFVSPYVALGSLYSEREENGAALSVLERAVHLDGINAEAWYLLAVVQRALGDFDGAHASIRQAMALRPAQASYRTEYLALTQVGIP
jgi:tetratricopeptide (TPR) repeat protein